MPLVSESVWTNAGTAAVHSTSSANQTFTCHTRIGNRTRFGAAVRMVNRYLPSSTAHNIFFIPHSQGKPRTPKWRGICVRHR